MSDCQSAILVKKEKKSLWVVEVIFILTPLLLSEKYLSLLLGEFQEKQERGHFMS